MFCATCGARLAEGQNFCSSCGRTVQPAGASTAPSLNVTRGRVERHLQIVAVLWFVWSALRLIPGVGLLVFGRFALPFLPFAWRALIVPIAAFAGVFFIGYAAAGFVGGWGLMQRRPWARMLIVILAVISLVHFPVGTALGGYSLWVLLPAASDAEYRRLGSAA